MSKTKKTTAKETTSLVVTTEVFDRILSGTIGTALMTRQQIAKDFRGTLKVYEPGRQDEALYYKVNQVMACGHGYLATGYPESYRTTGTFHNGTTVLMVERQKGKAPEESTDEA